MLSVFILFFGAAFCPVWLVKIWAGRPATHCMNHKLIKVFATTVCFVHYILSIFEVRIVENIKLLVYFAKIWTAFNISTLISNIFSVCVLDITVNISVNLKLCVSFLQNCSILYIYIEVTDIYSYIYISSTRSFQLLLSFAFHLQKFLMYFQYFLTLEYLSLPC